MDVAARLWRVHRALRGTQLPGIIVKAQLPPSLTAGLTIEHRLAVADGASDERAIVEVSLHEDHLRLFQRRKARPDTNLQTFGGEHQASLCSLLYLRQVTARTPVPSHQSKEQTNCKKILLITREKMTFSSARKLGRLRASL